LKACAQNNFIKRRSEAKSWSECVASVALCAYKAKKRFALLFPIIMRPCIHVERQGEFLMANAPLMPKATAVWLVDNTSLTFGQIAEFCKLHELEVKAIADGEAAQGIRGLDPVTMGQLTREELARVEGNPDARLRLSEPKVKLPEPKRRQGARYTPLSRRHDRPNAILWLLRNHGELKDSQIMRLVGTTKTTIESIRDRTHWNIANLVPSDPVTLGLCSQIDLDFEVSRAARNAPAVSADSSMNATLLPTEETTAPAQSDKEREDMDVANVFAKLKQMKSDAPADDEA
jgi:hypothetical protein